jgi:hypothetical protein
VKGFFQGLYQAVVGGSYIPDLVNGVEQWMGRLATTMPQLAGEGTAATEKTFSALGGSMQGFFSRVVSGFEGAIKGTQSWSDALKNLAADLLKMGANTIFRSLFGGGGGGFSFAGLPGFASGGSFNVGGSGGTDSQLVAFKASPNERVSVTKPGQGMGGGINVTIAQTNHFSSGITGTDRAWIEGSLAQNKEQTKQETIGLIRERRETDSGFI